MEPVINVVKQDINAAMKAFDKKDFAFVIMMGNRITSNLHIGNRRDFMVYGFMIREMGIEFEFIKARDENRIVKCKNHGTKLLKTFHSLINKKDAEAKDVWEAYFEFKSNIRTYHLSDLERSVYKDNLNFTRETTLMLVNHLDQNRELLLRERNQLIEGISNELDRVAKTHGLERIDLVFYLLLHALNGYYRYLLYSETKDGNIEDKKRFQEGIYPYVDKITKIFSEKNLGDIDQIYNKSNEILGDLGIKWRGYFINYLEMRRMYTEEKRVEIPKETRKKIGETISKAIEKEAKKK